MQTVRLGKTEIVTNKNGFGALPIQRISDEDAVHLLRKAYDHGVTYFDTARMYTDSEKKVGLAFEGMRDKILIATKTGSYSVKDFWDHLQTSLANLKTDYIDVYQFNNPSLCPKPGDGSGLYEAMLEAKETAPVANSARLADLLRRPGVTYAHIAPFDADRPDLPGDVTEEVEIQIKYAGYLDRQLKQVEEFKKEESRLLPGDVDYDSIGGLRLEARQKLNEIRPMSIGQAGRISGVSPSDIAVLLIWLEQQK